jgi:hypothetical protein
MVVTPNLRSCFHHFRAWCRTVDFTIFIAVFVTYAYFYQGGGQNESARFDAIRALLDEDHLAIDSFAKNSSDIIFVHGHAYSGKAPGTFYLGIGPFAVTEKILKVVGVDQGLRYHWACYVATVCGVSLLGAAMILLIYKLCLRLKASRKDAALVALTIGVGTIAFPFATVFFSHVSAAFFLLLAFYQILVHRQLSPTDDEVLSSPERAYAERWRLWVAGLSLGFSIVLEYPSAIGVLLILIYAAPTLFRHRYMRPQITVLAIALVGGLLPLFVYNLIAFHQPFFITYEAYAESTSSLFEAHKKGVLGVRIPLWDFDAWPQFWYNFKQITYKPLRGLFFANPVLIMIFAGFVTLIRRHTFAKSATHDSTMRDETLLTGAIFFGYLIFNASFGDTVTYWGGGASFGPRYLIVTLPFLALPLLASLQSRWTRPAFVPLALLSAFLCLMATAVDPRTPYEPENPIFFFYLPRFLLSNLATNAGGVFSNDLMTINSVAFNWGKLVGLPQVLQLFPLYLFWLWTMRCLDRQLQIPSRGFYFATGCLILFLVWMPLAARF